MADTLKTQKTTAAKGILLTVILLACCIVLPHYLLQTVTLPSRFFISRLSFWLALAIIFVYAKRVERNPFLLWLENKRGIIFYVASVLGILACVFVGSIIIVQALNQFGFHNDSKTLQQIMQLNFSLKLFAVFTATVTEEFIFRGYLMPRLQIFFKSAAWPVIISSLIFGIGHVGFGTVLNIAVPLFIGAVFALHYHKYRNLKVLILCHFLIDYYSLLVQH